MEARILKLQELSKKRKSVTEQFDTIRQESIKREEDNRRQEYIKQQIKQIPMRFRDKSFDHYETNNPDQFRVKTLAERYVETFKDRLAMGSSLVFYGNPGTGKTLLSLIIYQVLLQSNISVHYEASIEFLSKLITSKFKSQHSFQAEVDFYSRMQFLIIDEATESINKFGMPSEIEKQVLLKIINARYEKNLCTLMISNRDKQEIIHRLSEPVLDRLFENGITVAFNWESYRQK